MKPLKQFVIAADEMAQGNFDIELPEVKSREIDALRNAFNDMQASLVMAVARSMFRSASMQYTSPKQIVESINRSVCQSNDSYMPNHRATKSFHSPPSRR